MFVLFFFNDTATTEIYTLSLHDALPISSSPTAGSSCLRLCCKSARSSFPRCWESSPRPQPSPGRGFPTSREAGTDRKSTRLNSSHDQISYAVFCLKKKKQKSEPRLVAQT